MVREKNKEETRGAKYPPGVAKVKILLIVLNHPDGISGEKLIGEIKEKLPFTNNKGIKGHLDDLGPGRTVKGKWIEGKQYLTKIPSKYEPTDIKKKLIKLLENQEIETDIDNLPEENFWMPNPKRILDFSKYVLEVGDSEDLEHLQQSDFVLDCVAKKQSLLFEDKDAFAELKKMLRLSPRMFELCLKIDDLGEQYLIVHSHFDYYGISDFAAEEMFLIGSSVEKNVDYHPSVKHYIRWELFRSCLKMDTNFLETEEATFPDGLLDMIKNENIKRKKVEMDYISKVLGSQNIEEIIKGNITDIFSEELKSQNYNKLNERDKALLQLFGKYIAEYVGDIIDNIGGKKDKEKDES